MSVVPNKKRWIGLVAIVGAFLSLWFLFERWGSADGSGAAVAVAQEPHGVADAEAELNDLIASDGEREPLAADAEDMPAQINRVADNDVVLDFVIQLIELRQTGIDGDAFERVPYHGPGIAQLRVLGANRIFTRSTVEIVAGLLTVSLPEVASAGPGALVWVNELVLGGQPFLPVSTAILPLDGSVTELLVRVSPNLNLRVIDGGTGVELDRFRACWAEDTTAFGARQYESLYSVLMTGKKPQGIRITSSAKEIYRTDRLTPPDHVREESCEEFLRPASFRVPSFVGQTLWATAPGYSWGRWAAQKTPTGADMTGIIRLYRSGEISVCVLGSGDDAEQEIALLHESSNRTITMFPFVDDGCETFTIPAADYVAILRSRSLHGIEVHDRVRFSLDVQGRATVTLRRSNSNAANELASLTVVALLAADVDGDPERERFRLGRDHRQPRNLRTRVREDKISFVPSSLSPAVTEDGHTRWEWIAQGIEPGAKTLEVNDSILGQLLAATQGEAQGKRQMLPSVRRKLFLLPGANELILDFTQSEERRFHFVDNADGSPVIPRSANWCPISTGPLSSVGGNRSLSAKAGDGSTWTGKIPRGEIHLLVSSGHYAFPGSGRIKILEQVHDYEVRLIAVYSLIFAVDPSSAEFDSELAAVKFSDQSGRDVAKVGGIAFRMTSMLAGSSHVIFKLPAIGSLVVHAPAGWVFSNGETRASISPPSLSVDSFLGNRSTGLTLKRVIGD